MAEQNQHEYELVYILQPELNEDELMGVHDRIEQIVSSQNGEPIDTEIWGRRALAYPIKKHFEGQYILQRFQMEPEGAVELDRYLRFNENVIRFLVLRTDEL
jgi:small subunit ribosomal protein S6